jgi:hypothetical protein
MKAAIDLLFKRRLKNSEGTAREIDAEFRFHLEMLAEVYQQQDMPRAEAKDAAVRRFGNVERIKDQCLAISRRSHPVLIALKSFLILVFLSGVVVRVLSVAVNTRRMGDLLIAIPILSGLLLYVRSLNPSSFVSTSETASSLGLSENVQPLFTGYDHVMRTPVERLISDK